MIKKKKFVNYGLDNKKPKSETISLKLNVEEREVLDKCKLILEQPKDGTALKTLAWFGAKVLQEEKIAYLLGSLFKNKKNNQRLGIIDFD